MQNLQRNAAMGLPTLLIFPINKYVYINNNINTFGGLKQVNSAFIGLYLFTYSLVVKMN